MAAYLTSGLLIALIVSTTALDQSRRKDITTTMQEMQRASYFTFVTLLNMVQEGIPSNATFLMPSDRALSKALIPENTTLEFLLRHSIPSPLLFDDLSHFPTGTMVPTHQQDYVLKIVNRGRRGFYLNNVQVVSTDICTAASSFRCHGIYGVLIEKNSVAPPPTCLQTSPPTERPVGPSPAPNQPPPPPPNLVGPPSSAPTISLPPAESNDRRSGESSSSDRLLQRLFTTIVLCMALSTMKHVF